MKKITKYILPLVLVAAVSLVAIRCKKPTNGIYINVNTSDLFHYTALVQIADPSGRVPNDLSVAITGPSAAAIYGIDGKKALSAPAGIVAIAVHPKMEPTAGNPLKFNLVVTGSGYLPLTIPVTIATTQKSQVIKASILNLVVPTAGVGSTSVTATANAGTVVTPITASTPTTSGVESTSITVPTGTKLQDANGNTIAGNNVSVTVNNFSTTQQTAVNLFPGGSLSSNNIIDNTGATTSAVLLPAGFANIQMSVGGTEVKKFSSPINISMTLDPTFKNPTTGNAIAAGQTMEIDSYDTNTGQWKYEGVATVQNVGGNMVVNFTTTHLTIYAAVLKISQQTSLNIAINTAAPIPAGQAYVVGVVARYANSGPSYSLYAGAIILTSDNIAILIDLAGKLPQPTANNPIRLDFFDVTGLTLLGSGTISAGATTVNVTLTLTNPGPLTDLVLKLDCQGAGSGKIGIFTPPDFYLMYKPAGSASAYQLLGLVQNGELLTNQLLSSSNYDFLAVYGNYSKEVFNHNISENTPANQIVGGTFNGNHSSVINKLNISSLCQAVDLKLSK